MAWRQRSSRHRQRSQSQLQQLQQQQPQQRWQRLECRQEARHLRDVKHRKHPSSPSSRAHPHTCPRRQEPWRLHPCPTRHVRRSPWRPPFAEFLAIPGVLPDDSTFCPHTRAPARGLAATPKDSRFLCGFVSTLDKSSIIYFSKFDRYLSYFLYWYLLHRIKT